MEVTDNATAAAGADVECPEAVLDGDAPAAVDAIRHARGQEAHIGAAGLQRVTVSLDALDDVGAAIDFLDDARYDDQVSLDATNLDVDALVVAEASVGKSISMKRFATRARGRSTRIEKPFSRLRVVVTEQEEA